MIKKVVLDKADRLFHFPFDLEDCLPRRTLKTGEKKLSTIDLARLRWPILNVPNIGVEVNYRTATENDLIELKSVVADWLKSESGIKVDPKREIYIGQGIHRIIFDFCHAFIESGDFVLCPEPGMPFYRRFVISVGGQPISYIISRKTDYKPSFSRIAPNLSGSSKVLIINNPSNPCGTMMDETGLADLVRSASKQNLFIINDAAYYSLAEEKPVSIRAVPGGRKVGLEIYSFAYTFGLPYHPFGFAVGPPDIISGLDLAGRTIGNCLPRFWVESALNVIDKYPGNDLDKIRKSMARARLKAEQLAENMDWDVIGGKSCPFIWAKISPRKNTASYAASIFRKRRILIMPGTAFGETGEGYLRLSLTSGDEVYDEAIIRLSKKFSLSLGEED
jgi:aspartate/methionine/tyrosine aminotransferase